MRRALYFTTVLIALFAVGYAAYPLWSVWRLKDAVARGDVEAVRERVVWQSVRQSLRRSMTTYAGLQSDAATANGAAPRVTLWGRIKRSFGTRMLDRFIATYVTPEGFVRLHRMRARRKKPAAVIRAKYTIPGRMRLRRTAEAAAPTSLERAAAFLRRLKRIEFLSLTRVAIEIADRLKPDRHYVLKLGLRDGQWLLTGIEIVRPQPTAIETAGAH
jgi:Protein of unknown function (DUF2939)